MTSRFGRPDDSDGHSRERIVSSSTAPRTLADKLKHELGSERQRVLAELEKHSVRQPQPLLLMGLPPSEAPPATREPEEQPRRDFEAVQEDEERWPSVLGRQQPPPTYPPGWLGRQVRAGLLGLTLGLIGVVPTVFWLTGRFGDPMPQQSEQQSDVWRGETSKASFEIPTRSVATVDVPPVIRNVPRPIVSTSEPVLIQKDMEEAAEELLRRAQTLINDGEVLRAREVLSQSALADNPKAAFVLAETFDPNILAAMGVRGIRAEVQRARMLYSKALAGGVTAAEKRLEALN
jgi:hypothetical protein